MYGSKPEYVLPLVAKEGYIFTGWSGSIPTSMPANDVTISANWIINQYTISFDSKGGNDVSDITQDYNTSVNAPINPTKEGHTFVGWMVLSSETNQYEEFSFQNLTMPSYNIELVASWNVNSYEFTVVYNNGTSKTDTFTYEFEALVNPIEDPKYEGYAFDYWMCDGEVFSFQNYKMPAKDVTIIAIFENVYTLR